MFQYIYIHHIFFFFFFFFWLHHTTCRILVPRPRIEPGLPTVEAWSLNHWSTREFPYTTFCLSICWWTYAWYPYLGYYEISCQQHETELSLWDPDFSSFEWYTGVQISSVQFSRSVVSHSLRPHEPQYTRPPCPSPTPRVQPNSCPSSRWCNPAISSSVVPFSSCPQSFPASGCFPVSQLFASGGQSIGVSASTSILPMNTPDWSPLGWTGWISFQSKGLSRVFSNTTVQKEQFLGAQLSL